MKSIFLAITVLFVISLQAEYINVIEENEDELIVHFQLPSFKFITEDHNGSEYETVHCNEAIYTDDSGLPVLPYFADAVGIPQDGNIAIQIIDKKQSRRQVSNILPASNPVPKEDHLEYVVEEDRNFYRSDSWYPKKIIEKGDKAFVRDRGFFSFRIYPFQYSASRKEIIITSDITFKISISGNKKRSRDWATSNNYIDKVADSMFLNNDQSKFWRVEHEKISYHAPRLSEEIDELQFIIDEEGIYKITRQNLQEMLDEYAEEHELEFELAYKLSSVDPKFFELSSEKGIEPIHFVGEEDGSFDENDYFEFFGDMHYGDENYYDEYTAENTYTLKLTDHYGARYAVANGGIQFNDASMYEEPSSFEQTIHFEEQKVKNSITMGWEYESRHYYREDTMFWEKISGPSLQEIPFDLQYPEPNGYKKYHAKACLVGATFSKIGQSIDTNIDDHHALIHINQMPIDNELWNGQRQQIFQNDDPINNDELVHGENKLAVILPGAYNNEGELIENEQVLLDYFELTYWREYKTDTDYIRFTKPSDKPLGLFQFVVSNFSSDSVSVYKIGSSVFEHMRIEADNESEFASYTMTMQSELTSDNDWYVAVTENQKKLPKVIRPNLPSQLKDTSNSANLILITIEDFIDSEGAQLYKQVWEEQGNQVALVSTQDIYDEFNYGIRSSEAIKDFISYAYHNWNSPQLTHVLFLGDGTDDELDNSPDRRFNLIPVRHIWAETRGKIACDNWYGCIVGDDMIPDVSISRIGVWEEDQLIDVANKAKYYIDNPNYEDSWHGNIVMSAGGNPGEGSVFAEQSESLKEKVLDKNYHVRRVYCNTEGMPDDFGGNTTSLLEQINDGCLYVSFMGHGGGYVWADYNLLNKADIQTFNNENLPFFASMSCYGSAFNGNQSSCIGEELVIQPNRGGIAHVGFTGYGYESADTLVHQYIIDGIFEKKLGNIGEIADYTKTKFFIDKGYGNTGVALTNGFALLGDNMINLITPEMNYPFELEKYNVSEGDTLRISANFESDIESAMAVIYDENDVQLPLDSYFPYFAPVVNGQIEISNFIVPDNTSSIQKNYVKLFANGDERELMGTLNFTIGKSAMANLLISPATPTALDSIQIQADFFDEQGVDSVFCKVVHPFEQTIRMNSIGDESSTYLAENKIVPQDAGTDLQFYFEIYDHANNYTRSDTQSLLIGGPDLFICNYQMTSYELEPVLKVQIQNLGNLVSPECMLKLYLNTNPDTLLYQKEIEPLNEMEKRYEYIPLSNLSGVYSFSIVVNENEESFSELNYQNQIVNLYNYELNLFQVGLSEYSASSLDGYFSCEFPDNLFSENKHLSINRIEKKTAINQPDIAEIVFPDSVSSAVYEVTCFDETVFVDSFQTLPNDKKVKMEFQYSGSYNHDTEFDENYKVYRWLDSFQKWLLIGGVVDTLHNTVSVHSNQLGIFSIFANNDELSPSIAINVQGQEFSQENFSNNDDAFSGGYVSRNGMLSIVLSDANGIDAFTNSIIIEMDGNEIPNTEYTVALSLGNLTSIPVKYKMNNLSNGEHVMVIQCTDVNGNFKMLDRVRLNVYDEFEVRNFANYPNPVESQTIYEENEGKTRFTYVLTEDADDVKIKIYTVSGRLVKTFKNLPTSVGYHEYPRTVHGWDCRDDEGFYLANGIYFYKIIAKKGSKTVEKNQKMAILK